MSVNIRVFGDVFSKFPEYRRGIVIAHDIINGTSPDDLITSLRDAESALSQQLTPDAILMHPCIASWRGAYRSLGVKPSEFRPSVEALVRRVLKKDPLPAINKVVDLGNLISIQHLVPIGAHAIDRLTADMDLRLATGNEIFEPFGTDLVEHPNPGEIIFAEGDTVLTRRWTWRQSKHTLILPETTAVEFNVDALPPVTDEEVGQICNDIASLVEKYCGGRISCGVLSKDHSIMELTE
jgi:DNA/RNA-binding domain of Phe-tRNA-synthetase-like protein